MVARMTETFPRSNRTERKRKWHVCQNLKRRFGMEQKFIDNNIVLRDPADPYVPGIVRSDGNDPARWFHIPAGGGGDPPPAQAAPAAPA